jgi:iron(III) transport system permease protein
METLTSADRLVRLSRPWFWPLGWGGLYFGAAVATQSWLPPAGAWTRTAAAMVVLGPLVWTAVLGTFIMPNYLGAVAWILMAGPNAGWLNRAWVGLFGTDTGPLNIFSFWGLAFVIALYTYPLIYVFTKSALDLVSTELEDAAAIHGAGKFQTMARVTLPLVLPSILGAAILIFLEAIALYGTPALIAIPARINLATTQIVSFFRANPATGRPISPRSIAA